VVLALIGGGLWVAPLWGQAPSSTDRSVYDRRAPSKPSAASASTQPRRLPAAGPAEQRPLARPSRAKGYLSQGLASTQGRRPTPNTQPRQPAGATRTLTPTTLTPKTAAVTRATLPNQGVLPAFFPAPIGVGEPSKPVDVAATSSQQIALLLNATAPGEHPLVPAVRWAKTCMQKMDTIKDYSAKMAKRERIDGTLSDYEYMFIKVRHEPFSVYVSFLGPARVKGQEAIYVKGRNDGNLLGHANGVRKILGTVSLKPEGMLAMAGNRYPITEMGIRRLTERLIEVGEHDAQFGECEVKALPNTKINGRECVCLQVLHPVPRNEFTFNKAKIYVDSQLNVPVRYEAFEWPHEQGGEPLLMEEYTYLDLKFNNGFTDFDFDVANPAYQFK
jgi:outer membrane lipoprotein-sorting protein